MSKNRGFVEDNANGKLESDYERETTLADRRDSSASSIGIETEILYHDVRYCFRI